MIPASVQVLRIGLKTSLLGWGEVLFHLVGAVIGLFSLDRWSLATVKYIFTCIHVQGGAHDTM